LWRNRHHIISIQQPKQKALAIGAFMARALLGGLMGGGVAEALVVPIKAEITIFSKLTRK
jgi:flagellar motor component MotA